MKDGLLEYEFSTRVSLTEKQFSFYIPQKVQVLFRETDILYYFCAVFPRCLKARINYENSVERVFCCQLLST